MTDLLPCPFCGGDRVSEYPRHGGDRSGAVGCEACQALGPTLYVTPDPIAAWNRRASGWTSVKERLPAAGVKVLLFYARGSVSVGCLLDDGSSGHQPGRRLGESGPWWSSEQNRLIGEGIGDDGVDDERDLGPVTHWSPFPDPPA